MPNDYFEFKRFTVFQGGAAMKVGTDGVLLGAWAGFDGSEKRILDIGTGTGLQALLAAQRAAQARIDAVEIDPDAAAQAEDNVKRSPWAGRIMVHLASVQEFAARAQGKYDHILCNPPFFVGSLKAPDAGRTVARHNDTLSFDDLAAAVAGLLQPQGRLSVIYPVNEALAFESRAGECGLNLTRRLGVRGTPGSKVKRILMEFALESVPRIDEQELTIELSRHVYSEEYKTLTRDFYLKF